MKQASGRFRTGGRDLGSPTAHHDITAKQTTVRLPDDLAEQAEAVARARGTSVNALIINSLAAEIERARRTRASAETARRLLERDKELLERLAR
jgi:predicted transcriptional regulator